VEPATLTQVMVTRCSPWCMQVDLAGILAGILTMSKLMRIKQQCAQKVVIRAEIYRNTKVFPAL